MRKQSRFDVAFDRASTKEIKFLQVWRSFNDRYNLMTSISLEPGKLGYCTDRYFTENDDDFHALAQTSFVLIGTRFGTVVVQARPGTNECFYRVYFPLKMPVSLIQSLGIKTPVTDEMLDVLLGNHGFGIKNIGDLIEDIFNAEEHYSHYLEHIQNGGDPLVAVTQF